VNSREKGKVGERAWRDWLREQGYLKAYRGAQYCGLRGNADVVCPETPDLHYEVKRGERIDVYGAVEQAQRDSAISIRSSLGAGTVRIGL
jgi:hypothetical protein